MAGRAQATKPFNVRLPGWAIDYIDQRSAETGSTKTQVVVEALSCLRGQEVRALMAEGYEEMKRFSHEMAEEGVAAGSDCLPEW